mmetsp:Transcript_1271/g.3713  ORF Transcript_1271/g.3713 Transcript_1271/m.3713 type:complete len:383 (-) Transcript_1271:2631-3779(-)
MDQVGFVGGLGLAPAGAKATARTCRMQRPSRVAPVHRARRPSLVKMSAAKDAAAGGSGISSTGAVQSTEQRLRVGAFIALWYVFNIVYNISNKTVLNVYPYPWFVAWIQLAIGAVYALLVWATRLRKMPNINKDLIKSLVPVAIFHNIGHVSTVVSLGAVAVSFTHVVKAMEPFVNVVASAIILKSIFPIPVYLSLLPVVGGVIMASVTEVSFTWMGFLSAMTSNFAFVGRNIYSKMGMSTTKDENLNGANLFAVMSCIAVVLLAPFPFIMEGTSFITGWNAATSGAGAAITSAKLAQTIGISGLFFHMYQEVAFLALDSVHPVTHSVANTVKRVVIIVTSIIVFKNPVTQANALGSAIAILGVLLYSLIKNYYAEKEAKKA